MADEIKKTIRITPEMAKFLKETSDRLKMSENDTIKMIIFLAQIKVF